MPDRAEDSHRSASEVPTRTAASAPAPPSPLTPRRIGGFEIRRQLDAGGMGIVYEALQDEPRRTVALKVMRRGLPSKSAQRRFEFESQLLARLSHPGIAVVYEAGTHHEHGEEFPYFAMEYISGARHLTAYAASHGLTLDQRLRLMAEVCDAVHHAHLRSIVHRDLKPANVLVGSSGIAKIIDFGVARALDSDLAPATQQTDVGQVVGTLQYMSPEQVFGDPHDIDARSDVYALGLILFELVTGVLPYDVAGLSPTAAAAMIRDGSWALPPKTGPALRGDLRVVVLKAMQRDRDVRYASADALARDLRHVLAGEPVEARAPTLTYLVGSAARRQVRTHPWLSLLGGAAAAMAVAVFLIQPLIFRWSTAPAAAYEWLAAKAVRTPTSIPALDRLGIVAINDGTDFEALASELGVEGVSMSDPLSLRTLHGKLMERLAASGARAVAWDIFFGAGCSSDAAFRAGLVSLTDAGITPILGVGTWEVDDHGAPMLNETIVSTPGVRWGPCSFSTGPQRSLDVALRRPGAEAIPSLALLAACAARQPGLDVSVELDEDSDTVRVHRWKRHPTIDGARAPDGPPEEWRVTAVQRVTKDEPEFGTMRGDLIGGCTTPIADDAAFEAVTLDYARVALASTEELRSWYSGKVVLIGDRRPAKGDYSTLPDGRLVWGGNLQAAGFAALLDGRFATVPNAMTSYALTAGAALLGALAAAAAGRRGWRLAGVVVLMVAVSVPASLLAYRYLLVLVNPAVPAAAMILASALGWHILRGRAASQAVAGPYK